MVKITQKSEANVMAEGLSYQSSELAGMTGNSPSTVQYALRRAAARRAMEHHMTGHLNLYRLPRQADWFCT